MQELVPTQAQFIDIDDIALPTPAAASASLFSSNSGVAAASLCGAKFEAVVEQHYALLHDQKLHKMTSNYNLLCTLCCRSRLTLHWRSVRICQQLPGPLFTTRVVQAKQDARANRSITPAWLGLVRSVTERAEQMHNTIRQFAFVLPPPPVVSAGPQLHPVDSQWWARHQLDGCRQRHILRHGLEPCYGRAGTGSGASHRADPRRAHLSPGVREHRGGEYSDQSPAEEAPGLFGDDGRQLQRSLALLFEWA